jgi:hypothetical protein
VKAFEDFCTASKKHQARSRGHQAALLTLEEAGSQLKLEVPYAPINRRGFHVQRLGGSAKRAMEMDRKGGLEMDTVYASADSDRVDWGEFLTGF